MCDAHFSVCSVLVQNSVFHLVVNSWCMDTAAESALLQKHFHCCCKKSGLWQMEKEISDTVANIEAAKDKIIEVRQESHAASDAQSSDLMVNVMRLLKP